MDPPEAMDPPDESGDPTRVGQAAPIEQAALYRTVIENTPVVIYIDVYEPGDDQETPLFISPQIERLLGYSAAEWIAEPKLWRDHIHPEDRPWVEKAAADASEKLSADYRMVRKGGGVIWVHEEAAIIGGRPDGRVLWHGALLDITERKEAEAQREFAALLMESISDAVVACDRDLVITSWNRAAQDLYGWTPTEVVGRPMREVLRYELSEMDRSDVWDPFAEEMLAWRGRAIQHDKNGSEVLVETKGLPLRDAQGQVSGYVMVNREVAEQAEQ